MLNPRKFCLEISFCLYILTLLFFYLIFFYLFLDFYVIVFPLFDSETSLEVYLEFFSANFNYVLKLLQFFFASLFY